MTSKYTNFKITKTGKNKSNKRLYDCFIKSNGYCQCYNLSKLVFPQNCVQNLIKELNKYSKNTKNLNAFQLTLSTKCQRFIEILPIVKY